MANSKYEHVRSFEQSDPLLPNTWIVIRLDGRGFHSLSQRYEFEKPNDIRALNLMNAAACAVVKEIPDVCIAYGMSDEFSFVLHPSSTLFDRRASKLLSTVVSLFTAAYTFLWPRYLPTTLISPSHLPTFDARIVLYPSTSNLRDYLSWRQVDTHINNLYNTTFWAMRMKGGIAARQCEDDLKGTVAADKNEILWSRYGINYNDEADIFKKGSVVFREVLFLPPMFPVETDRSHREKYELEPIPDLASAADIGVGENDKEKAKHDSHNPASEQSKTQQEKSKKARRKANLVVEHLDIIKDDFWNRRPWILSGRPGKSVVEEVKDQTQDQSMG